MAAGQLATLGMTRLMSRAHDDVIFIAEGTLPPVKMASSCPLVVIQPGGLVTKEQKDSMSQHNVRQLT